jgi:preflagellin peptidase FlaK
MFASVPDLLRLLVVPAFAWAAWRDVRTRRLPNRLWTPLVVLGLLALALDVAASPPLGTATDALFLFRVAFSVCFVVPLSYVFWRLGAFGGADAKALMTLALVFPTFPSYVPVTAPPIELPLQSTALGVFSMTILTNTVLVGLAYPVVLAVRNLAAGDVSPVMFLGRRVDVDDLPATHGRLFEDADGATDRGLDLDALRMYLRWRGLTLAELREDPSAFRPASSVGPTHAPTDGRIHVDEDVGAESESPTATDGGRRRAAGTGSGAVETVEGAGGADTGRGADTELEADPWGAERFLSEIDGTAYGTTPGSLREGLAVVADRERVWVSPGLPFVVPMFVGLLLALTYGDLLFGLLGAVGLV